VRTLADIADTKAARTGVAELGRLLFWLTWLGTIRPHDRYERSIRLGAGGAVGRWSMRISGLAVNF
jgi:hypothetical protein